MTVSMLAVVACALFASASAFNILPLSPDFRATENQTVVTGLSAGAYMAVQYHVAFSSSVVGSGIVAGGPFYCAEGSQSTALTACMSLPYLIDVSNLVLAAKSCASGDACDDVSYLKNHKVWMFSGTRDTVVKQGVMKALNSFYSVFVGQDNINFTTNVPAEHSWPTNSYGNGCGWLGSPYINNCHLDASYQMLDWVLGGVNAPTAANNSNVRSIDQSPYVPSGASPASISLADTGYVYVPQACNTPGACRIVIALHGCQMTVPDIGLKFVLDTGLNAVAEANNFVVLYPQAVKSLLIPENPEGCFDWWGYTGADYANQHGPQMATIKAMVDALTGKV